MKNVYHWSSTKTNNDGSRNESVKSWIKLGQNKKGEAQLADHNGPLALELLNHPGWDE